MKQGGGKLVLTHANTYTGSTSINLGSVQMGAAGAIPSGTPGGDLAINGVLDLNSFPLSVSALSGAGTIDSAAAGNVTFTVGNNDRGGTFVGAIKNTSGTVSFAKTGNRRPDSGRREHVLGLDHNFRWNDSFVAATRPAISPQLWLDATAGSSLVINGSSNIAQWNDKSGNNRNSSQAVTANQPVYKPYNPNFQGLPMVSFGRIADFERMGPTVFERQQLHYFLRRRPCRGGKLYYLGTVNGTTNQGMHIGYNNNTTFWLGQYGNDLGYTLSGYTSQVAREWTCKLDTSSGHSIYLNGSVSPVVSNTNLLPFVSQSPTGGIVGAGFGNSNPFVGDLGEIIIFQHRAFRLGPRGRGQLSQI